MEKHMHTPEDHEPIEKLVESLLSPSPEFVVLSGGPCAGKSTILDELPSVAAQNGRQLVVMPEVATEYMRSKGCDLGQLARQDRASYLRAQTAIIEQMLDFVNSTRRNLAGQDALVVLDRGVRDCLAYITRGEAEVIGQQLGQTFAQLGHDVDKVIYLPSLATQDSAAYEQLRATNPHRRETAEEAAATCQRTLRAWTNHPEIHLVGGNDFDSKVQRAIRLALNGDNEFERKWEVVPEATAGLPAPFCHTRLSQSYGMIEGLPIRIRHGQTDGGHEFFHLAVKEKTPTGNREARRSITARQYYQLLPFTPRALTKDRYAFFYSGQVWHLDRLGDRLFLEAEVSHPDELGSLELPLAPSHMTICHQSMSDFATI